MEKHLKLVPKDGIIKIGPRVKPPKSTLVTEGIVFSPIDFLFPVVIIAITTYLAITYYDRWFDIVIY